MNAFYRLATVIAALFVTHAMAGAATAQTAGVAPIAACTSPDQKIDEAGFIAIGGIQQWVTIKGDSCANPVILVLHGGPGNTLSPYADNIYGAWQKHFTLVQWDQRGAGMTFGRNPPAEGETLTIQRMRDDGIELAAYLAQHLGKPKIIVMSSSWSSILGVYMVKARPDLFYAYLGASQIVGYRINQTDTYAHLLRLTHAAGDTAGIAVLEAQGAPPWTNPRSSGAVRKIVRKYEALTTDPEPGSWWQPAPAYATDQARADYSSGEDYSYIQFVGMHGDGMYSGVDLPKLGTTFDLPVFIVAGAQDLLTAPEIARDYFDSLTAPQKAFVLVPRAGHDPNQAKVDAEFTLLEDTIMPLTGATK